MIEGSLTKQHWNSFFPFLGPCLIHCKDRIREKTGKKGENMFQDTYAPSFKEVEGAYWFGVVLACVHPSMSLFVTLFEACHILWTVHARVLKFHIWVPHGKIADTHLFFLSKLSHFLELCPFEKVRMKSYTCHILWTVHARVLKFHVWIPHGQIADQYFFSCLNYLPFWNYAPLKRSE